MRRILHLIDTGGPGGGETVLGNLVEGLGEEGWMSRVVLPRKAWLFERLSGLEVDLRVIPSHGSADFGFLWRLIGEIGSFAPDLIHAHFLTSGVYGTLAARLTGSIPLVCTFHGVPDIASDERFLGVKGRILGGNSNRIVYVSEDLRRRFEALLSVPEELGLVIHNGVRFFEASTHSTSEKTRRDLGLKPGSILVGAVGNVRPAKDYHTLVRAARIVCDDLPNVHFAVVGQARGELWEDIKRLVGDLDLKSKFRFLGFRENPAHVVNAFDLFVSSSSSEGLPLAPVEAMGLGKPVVLTRCGGVPEVVVEGKTGLLVQPGDPTALAHGISHLLRNPQVAKGLGAAAKTDVRARFSVKRMLADYQVLYREMIPSTRGPHA